MPYVWLAGVVFYGWQDEVFLAITTTIGCWTIMFCNEEVRAMKGGA